MKLITCRKSGQPTFPAVLSADEQTAYPLASLGITGNTLAECIPTLMDPAAKSNLCAAMSDAAGIPVNELEIDSPIPEPAQDVICLGINYMAHSDEAARYSAAAFVTKHEDAIYFSKRVSHAVPPNGSIDAHADLVQRLDYECELAVVLGRDAYKVPAGQTRDYVFGYTILNDVSARDVQTSHKQWYFGKSLDGFTPIGPCILTADAVESYPPQLELRCFVNGEKRQDSNTRLQIFDIDHVISELSQGMTLKAGTIIATGTPAGVGMGFDPPRFLQHGDVVRCEIEGIGILENTVE
jgi:2-keto-4-pentenoate hydratase/2-oxohepta-3-ene-1,7-dioic acid hydratase in catechol pathway